MTESSDDHRAHLEAQQPILAHAPNLSFHSCLYFSHHSSSQVWRVSPQTMILNRACSSAVHATPSNSPLVTGAALRSRPAEAIASIMITAKALMSVECVATGYL